MLFNRGRLLGVSDVCVVIRRGVLFFCFKQKTAYEMRISDWSSDVCSSDLPDARTGEGAGGTAAGVAAPAQRPPGAGADRPGRAGADRRQERKSVVKGKSVSVRVDLGGRRIIKKKTTRTYYNIVVV